MHEALERIVESDRQHFAETGEKVFFRAAEPLEIKLYEKFMGAPDGLGPRVLFLIIGEDKRIFISWPRDAEVPKHTEQHLRFLLDAAEKLGQPVLSIDPSRKN